MPRAGAGTNTGNKNERREERGGGMMKKIKDRRVRGEVLWIIDDASKKIQDVLTCPREKEDMRLLMAVCFNAAASDASDKEYVIPERYMTGFIKQWADKNGLYNFSKI